MVGASVNLEADVIARYAERLLLQAQPGASAHQAKPDEEITSDWLNAHGWG